VTVRVLFFAYLRDLVKTASADVEVEAGARVKDVERSILERWPVLDGQLVRLPIVLEGKVVDADALVREGAEIVWLPPVGGGAPASSDEEAALAAPKPGVVRAALTREPLDAARLTALVRSKACGGVTTFVGEVRDRDGERRVLALEYDAYDTLASSQIAAIAAEAAARWPEARIAVEHRAGRLVPGDAAVVVAVACPHRAEAFDCCRHVIDRVKEAVPIWKKELSAEGDRWVEGTEYRA
jgi:molybdopterin synthase catalytic subunit